MERRKDPRFAANQVVGATLLGAHPMELEAVMVNISGRGMRLLVNRAVPYGAAIRVEVEGSTLLGEVCYAEAEGDRYAVGLMLDQVLHESPALLNLIDRLRVQPSPAKQSNRPVRQ